LGIKYYYAVPVAHCPHSSAITIDGTAFGKNVYSGDCQPSDRLCEAGVGADLLIHEATFEIGMEEEASLNKHCTVGEALDVTKKMEAKAVLLTHFSQRYPKSPPLLPE
jgi:ribonuclease Z